MGVVLDPRQKALPLAVLLVSALQRLDPLINLLEGPTLKRRRVDELPEVESVVVWTIAFRMVRRSADRLLMAIYLVVMEEQFHLPS